MALVHLYCETDFNLDVLESRAIPNKVVTHFLLTSYPVTMGRRAKHLTVAQQASAAHTHKQAYLATPRCV